MAVVLPIRAADASGELEPAAGEFQIDAPPPLMPEGIYELMFEYHETVLHFGSGRKVVLWFKVCQPGPEFGTRLARYYNVKNHYGRLGRGGRFRVARGGDLAIEYCTLMGKIGRFDRLAFARLRNEIVLGRVRTVTTNSNQRNLPQPLQYSVIADLLGLKKL